MEGKALGKIESVRFGITGRENEIGIELRFNGTWGTIGTNISAYDPTIVIPTESYKWTEIDRREALADVMCKISKIMAQAKIIDLNKLKGVPVEVEIVGNILKSWRVLEEVL